MRRERKNKKARGSREMELEYRFQMTTFLMVMQMVCVSAAYCIEQMTGGAMMPAFVRKLAAAVVNYGPAALLVYVLVKVSQLY
jgi:hypothetical protein